MKAFAIALIATLTRAEPRFEDYYTMSGSAETTGIKGSWT